MVGVSQPQPPRKRSVVYIDGFNFYYGALRGGPHRWLDIEKFFVLLRQNDVIQTVRYFTALVTDSAGKARQLTYLRALATRPLVETHLGRFKTKRVDCKVQHCSLSGSRRFSTFEEKRTDVNIGLMMLDDGYQDICDRFVVVSGDSDLVPAIHAVKKRFPHKEVIVYVPARDRTRGAAVELRAAADKHRTLPLAPLPRCQLPPAVEDSGGLIAKPAGW